MFVLEGREDYSVPLSYVMNIILLLWGVQYSIVQVFGDSDEIVDEYCM